MSAVAGFVRSWRVGRFTVELAAPRVRSKRPSEIAGAITEFLTVKGAGCLRGALAKHFEGRYVRTSVYREIDKMIGAGLLIHVGNVVVLPGASA